MKDLISMILFVLALPVIGVLALVCAIYDWLHHPGEYDDHRDIWEQYF